MNALARAFFATATSATVLAVASAEVVVLGGRVVLNDGELGVGGEGGAETAVRKPDPAGPQVLEFTSGDQLHGSLEAIDSERKIFTWRRNDAAGPLLIPFEQIRRFNTEEQAAVVAPALATIKFTGGDWLAAEVTAIQGDKIQLRLADGLQLTTDRTHVEWIYFGRTATAECYDGPTSFSGWTTTGGWSYRDGALRASSPAPVTRMFRSLPDRVDYRLTIDQGGSANAFSLAFHSRTAIVRGMSSGVAQLMLRGNLLQLFASIGGSYKTVQTDLSSLFSEPLMRGKNPLHLRVLEDFAGGRILVYLNGRKAAEWTIDKGVAGKNGGGVQFQPMSWTDQKEQSLANIKVLPWDGLDPSDEETPESDRLTLADGGTKTGKVVSWNGRALKIGAATVPGEKITMLRFLRPENPPEDDAPVARVRLNGRGEFDAVGVDWREGKVLIRTNFSGEIALPAGAVAELDFLRPETKEVFTDDVLVFRNGDRLRGSLAPATGAPSLRWQTGNAGSVVEFTPDNVASLLFAPRVSRLADGAVARFRNGDWISGKFLTLDREQLVLDTTEAGQLSIPRTATKALYFATNGAPAVSDAVADHEAWERGVDFNTVLRTNLPRKQTQEFRSPWIYAAGSYTMSRPGNVEITTTRGSSMRQLGRKFENLTPRAEISFRVSAERTPVYFSAQLFTDASNPGYMLNLSTAGLSVYDLNPRARARGVTQQQFPFGKEIKPNATERHLRMLADRSSGRLTILVDGAVVAKIAPKTADGIRTLGSGFVLNSPATLACTFADFWVGPWNGEMPDKEPAADTGSISLANGDEMTGSIEMATPATAKIVSEIGPLELALERLNSVDFGGSPALRTRGTRLQLAGQGALTVSDWRIENEIIVCRSEVAGELKLPLSAVQELIFPAPTPPPAK